MRKGWQKQRLAEIAEKIVDGSHNPPKGVPESDYLMLSSKNVFDDNLHYADPRYLTADQFQQEDKRTGIVPGDVLLTIVGTVGRSAVVPIDTPRITLQRSVAVIRTKRRVVEPRFLMYSFIERNAELNEQARGVAQKGIYLESLRELYVMVPPLPEQQRIVGILDEAFEGIATAKANAEKNLQNARALFESYLNSVFNQRGKGWIEKTLGNVFSTATGTTPPKNNANFYGDFMPLVKPPELCDAPLDSAPDGLSKAGAAVARTLPSKSILVSCIGNLGKIGLNTVPVAFNQQINAILPDESLAIPEFMFFQSLSYVFRGQLESLASGTTVPIVNKSKFNSVKIVLPPLSSQKPVVAQLNFLRDETQHLESIYQCKLEALEELKKSLLNQAFSGGL